MRACVYKSELSNPWNRIFQVAFPEEIASYARKQRKLIVEFARAATTADAYPDHAMAAELLRQQFIRTSNLTSVQAEKISVLINDTIRDTHRFAPLAIKEFLEPMYTRCATQGGKLLQSFSECPHH